VTVVDEERATSEHHIDIEVPERLVGLIIGLSAFAWQAVLVLRGYFWQDDFILVDRAATTPLDAGYLLAAHNGNVTPGGNLIVWLVTRLSPMNYHAAVVPVLVLQLLALVLAWRLLTGIFGTRWAVLVPFTVFAAAPMLLTSSLWWSQALETVPLVVAMLGALDAQARYLRTRRRRYAVAGVVWTFAGLLFWDKALLIPLVVFGLTALLAPPEPQHKAAGWALRRHWQLWVAYGALGVSYLIFYLTRTDTPNGLPSFGDLLALLGRMIGVSFLPGVLGGPWKAGEPYNTVWSFHATWVPVVVWVLTSAIVVGSIVLRRSRAALAWTLLFAYLVAIAGLLAIARLDQFGPGAGNDPRYVADAVPVAVLCGAFAFLRPEDEREPLDHKTLRWLRPAVAVVTAVFVLGTVLTATTALPQYSHADTKHYVQTVRDSTKPGMSYYDTGVPTYVMVPWFGSAARTSTVLGHLPNAPAFDAPSGDMRLIDGLGIPRPIELLSASPAQPGPVRDCGYAVHTEPVELPLTSTVDGTRLVVRVGYYSAKELTGSVQAGRSSHDVTFLSGLHVLYFVVDGPVDRVRLWHNGTDDTVCVSDALVGTPVPSS
jgi:hypothetical protein